jgi:hypothetical protein
MEMNQGYVILQTLPLALFELKSLVNTKKIAIIKNI